MNRFPPEVKTLGRPERKSKMTAEEVGKGKRGLRPIKKKRAIYWTAYLGFKKIGTFLEGGEEPLEQRESKPEVCGVELEEGRFGVPFPRFSQR